VRSFFRDETTILLDLKQAMKAVTQSLMLFQVFVGLIGVIALTLAFFLLLVSTTQNVKENVWEYGCLRAMGFNKQQGMRSFMYE
jgi:ABC-type lipoprotein release transport system permease subunit